MASDLGSSLLHSFTVAMVTSDLKREVAHFFWHGTSMSCYEQACISSFVSHGFEVNVWSYRHEAVLRGTQPRDASEVLPQSDLTRYTQGGIRGNITSFSNFFRYELLSHHDGWWLDTDVLCLRPMPEFRQFVEPVVAGLEKPGAVNTAVMKFGDRRHAFELKKCADAIAARQSDTFSWGEVGPLLLDHYMRSAPEGGLAARPVRCFYPINYYEADVVLDPDRRSEADARCAGAFTYHFWNEILRRWAIPKQLMPPKGSFLHAAFVEADPSLATMPTLPKQTLHALARAGRSVDLGFMHHARELVPSLVRAIRKRVKWRADGRDDAKMERPANR